MSKTIITISFMSLADKLDMKKSVEVTSVTPKELPLEQAMALAMLKLQSNNEYLDIINSLEEAELSDVFVPVFDIQFQ